MKGESRRAREADEDIDRVPFMVSEGRAWTLMLSRSCIGQHVYLNLNKEAQCAPLPRYLHDLRI